jgi:hypothetical protein
MKENPDVSQLFSDPYVQIKFPGVESLCRYGLISLQLHETKRVYGGTKSFGSGTLAVASRNKAVPQWNQAAPRRKTNGRKRCKINMLRISVPALSGTRHKKGRKRGFTRVLGPLKRP